MVFQEIRVLQVLQDSLVNPNLVHQDPKVSQDPQAQQVSSDLLVNLDQTVKVQSQGLMETLVVLEKMESQGVWGRWGIQVRTFQYLEMRVTMGTWGARGQMAKRDLQGPQDGKASTGIQDPKVSEGLQVSWDCLEVRVPEVAQVLVGLPDQRDFRDHRDQRGSRDESPPAPLILPHNLAP